MRFFKYIFAIFLIIIVALFFYPKLKVSASSIPLMLREANKSLLFILLGFQVLTYISDAWLSQILLKTAGFRMKFLDNLKIAVLGNVGTQAIPLMGGPLTTYFSCRKLKVPSKSILFLTISWTLFIWLTYALLFLVSLLFMVHSRFSFNTPSIIFLILFFFLLCVFSYLLLKRRTEKLFHLLNFFVKIINRFGNRILKRDIINLEKFRTFGRDFSISTSFLLANKRKIPRAFIATFLYCVSVMATLYFSFLTFGYKANVAYIIFGFFIASLAANFTFVSDAPGVTEASLATVFINLGYPAHVVLFSSILFRLFSYWLSLPFGLLAYLKLKRKDVI